MKTRAAFRFSLGLIILALGVLACDANSFVNLINENNPVDEPVIGIVTPTSTAAAGQPSRALPCAPLNANPTAIAVCKFTVVFVKPVTTYTVEAVDLHGGALTYQWLKTQLLGPCGVWTPQLNIAQWSHPDKPSGNCPKENVHDGTISVIISSTLEGGGSVECLYTGGSASGDTASCFPY